MPVRPDAHESSTQHLPSLTADRDTDAYFSSPYTQKHGAKQGKLWLAYLCLIALGGAAAWWGEQKMRSLEAELMALKEHQNRTVQGREDFAEQLKTLQRRLSAIEAQPVPDLQPLSVRLQSVEHRLSNTEQSPVTQNTAEVPEASAIQPLATRQVELEQHLEKLQGHLDAVNDVLGKLQAGMTTILDRQNHLEAEQAKWSAQLEQQQRDAKADLELAKKQWVTPVIPDHSPALKHLEQDILVLRSEVERMPKPVAAASNKPSVTVQEFDVFRSQTTRHITALQGQVANLQDQIDRKQ